MKKARIFLFLMAMALLVIGLVPTMAQDATATPAPTATFIPSVEGTLTIWADELRTPAIEKLGAEFTAQYSVPVQVQQMDFGSIRTNLKLGAAAGQGPDLIMGAHDWVGELVAAGVIAPVDLSDEVKANINPAALQAFTYNGELYGLPIAIEAIALFYNTDLVSKVPATWAETVDLAQQLVADGKAEIGIAIPNNTGDPYHHYPFFTGFGGYVFGRDAKGDYNPQDLGLDSPGGIAAMQEIDRLVKAGVLNEAVNGDIAKQKFMEGKLAMWITGPWNIGDTRASGVPFNVAPIPKMDQTPRPFSGVQAFMVNAFSDDALLAQAFLSEFVATDEGMKMLFDADPRTPVWLPLADTLDDPIIASFIDAAANAEPMPAIPEMNAVWSAWGNAITLVYQQKEDPAKAIQDAAQAIRDEIAKASGG